MIRSALIADKIAIMDEKRESKQHRFYSMVDGKKVFLFGFQKADKKNTYYRHINSFANALAAVGYYERAMYRWSGVFTAEELNMKTSLPNDNLQESFDEAVDILEGKYNHNDNDIKMLSVKNIIANDLIMATEKARISLNNEYCNYSHSNPAHIPAHELNLCSEMKKIHERAISTDLKRLVCTTGNKISEENIKTPDDVISNAHWEAAGCDQLLAANPKFKNLNINSIGKSYYEIIPSYLNPLKLSENIKKIQERLDEIKEKVAAFAMLQTQEFQNKKTELADNILSLEENLQVSKKAQNKAAEELAYYSFQKDASFSMFESARVDAAENLIEQKNQFRIYLSNIIMLDSLQELKRILNGYKTNKEYAIAQYKQKLCGDSNLAACDQSGTLGTIATLSREKKSASIQNWKNSCSRMVRQRNDIANTIGRNGCDISRLTNGISASNDAKTNNAIVIRNLQGNPEYNSNRCRLAALSEVMANSGNSQLNELISLNVSDSKEYFDQQQNKLNNLRYDYTTTSSSHSDTSSTTTNTPQQTSGTTSTSTSTSKSDSTSTSKSTGMPSFDSMLKSDYSFLSSVTEAHTYKIYLEQELFVNSQNERLLSNPENYCSELYKNSQQLDSSSRPKITSILDAQITSNQNILQSLQIKYALNQDSIELDKEIDEKNIYLDNQINSITQTIKNLESVLGVAKNVFNAFKNKPNHSATGYEFESFYARHLANLNYLPLKNANHKKNAQENQFKASEKNVSIAQENFEIAKKQVLNLQSSIQRAKTRADIHNTEFFLFTSISPKTTSFSNDLWQIEYVRNLARQIVNMASVRILNMDPLLRNVNDQNSNFSNIVQNISDVKYSCSYLASFDDANKCLSKIKKLENLTSLKNEANTGTLDKSFTLQIFSSELRNAKGERVFANEQLNDEALLTKLNETGIMDINLNEEFFKVKYPPYTETFDEDFYKARIVGVITNIYTKGPMKSRFKNSPFGKTDNVAYLLHDGLYDESSKGVCPQNYSEYSEKIYHNYRKEVYLNGDPKNNVISEYKRYGNQYPFMFSKFSVQQLMCDRNDIIRSLSVISPSSSIKYIDAENNMKPISIFATTSDDFTLKDRKIRTMQWFEKLKAGYRSARPSEAENYWQPLIGFMGDSEYYNIFIEDFSKQVVNCLNVNDLNSFSCANAKEAVYQSFSGLPLLGEYKFIYARHSLDNHYNRLLQLEDPNSEIQKVIGVEINFIISK